MMKKDDFWKYIFPALSVILWIAAIVLFFRSISPYGSHDYEAQAKIAKALRWRPACFIGAVISTAASYVIFELLSRIEK